MKLVATLAAAALATALAGQAHATGRFDTPSYFQTYQGGAVCYDYLEGVNYPTGSVTGPGAQGSFYVQSQFYSYYFPNKLVTRVCYNRISNYDNVRRGDLMFFFGPMQATAPTTRAQRQMWGNSAMTHTTVCDEATDYYSGGNYTSYCTRVTHSTADQDASRYSKGCGGLSDGAQVLNNLEPGVSRAYAASRPELLSSGMRARAYDPNFGEGISNAMLNHPVWYGQRYAVKGFSHNHWKSQCSQFVNDVVWLWPQEGGNSVCIPQATVRSIETQIHDGIYNDVNNGLGWLYGFAAVICAIPNWFETPGWKAANQVINAFNDEDWRNNDSVCNSNDQVDRGETIRNVTGTPEAYLNLSGTYGSFYAGNYPGGYCSI